MQPTQIEKAVLEADGGSRGNPGPAASAFVLTSSLGLKLARRGEFLGHATNNVAEWRALLLGLKEARHFGIQTLTVRMDSELVIKQCLGQYRVKHIDLKPLFEQAVALIKELTEEQPAFSVSTSSTSHGT